MSDTPTPIAATPTQISIAQIHIGLAGKHGDMNPLIPPAVKQAQDAAAAAAVAQAAAADSAAAALAASTTASQFQASGAGAALRSQTNKGRERISLLDYYNAESDHTSAAQKAETYAASVGGRVFIPAGVFEVDSTLWTPADLDMWWGDGDLKDGDQWVALGAGKPFVVLAMGQSNMKNFANAANEATDLTVAKQVYMLDTDATDSGDVTIGTVFNRGQYGNAPMNILSGFGNPCVSLAFEGAKALQKRLNRPVFVIQLAAGGHPIESFLSDTMLAANGWTRPSGSSFTNLYAQLFPGLALALAKIPGNPVGVDAFWWHQGESNSADGVETYARKFDQLCALLQSFGRIDGITTPVVTGELVHTAANTNYLRHRAALNRMAIERPTVRVVPSQGCTTIDATNMHFNGQGVLALARRYADATLSPRPAVNEAEEDPKLPPSTYGLTDWTTSTDGAIQNRAPIGLTTGIRFDSSSVLGPALKAQANTGAAIYTRKLYRLPVSGVVRISYELLVDDPAGSVDHRANIQQFDASRTFISLKSSTPSSSPASGADGRVLVSRTFGRAGSGADLVLDAGCEWVAIGVAVGVGADDEACFFNILEVKA